MDAISKSELQTALQLIKDSTSIKVVSNFLRNRELAHSAGSWDDLIRSRVEPALASGQLDRTDIIKLLRSVEEHGRQHVLLFSVGKHISQPLMSEGNVRKSLKKYDLETLLDNPKIINLPNGQVLTDVRIVNGAQQRELVIKAVDGRKYRRIVSRKTEGQFETIVYENYEQRAVNVVRVQENGAVDVRIQSHQRVIDYASEAERLLQLCIPLFERERFTTVPVTAAKMYIASKPTELRGLVRWGNGLFRNRKGGGMSISTGHEQQNLYEDEGAVEGTAAFLRRNDGYCEEANIYWIARAVNSAPSEEIHSLIAGAINEFAINGQCSAADYEYVLAQIKRANQKR